MAGFWSAIWSGSTRTIRCPYCRREQSIARRPTPFEHPCASCGRPFRVEASGAVPIKAR